MPGSSFSFFPYSNNAVAHTIKFQVTCAPMKIYYILYSSVCHSSPMFGEKVKTQFKIGPNFQRDFLMIQSADDWQQDKESVSTVF